VPEVLAVFSAIEPDRLTARAFDAYGFAYLAAVYLAFVLAALLFKPEHIRRKWLLLVSLCFFAMSLILPCWADLDAYFWASSGDGSSVPARLLERRSRTRPLVDCLVQVDVVLAILTGIGALGRPAAWKR
jgi:hypothetical protein